jgi:predicted RNA binding protein YcfA (HicA-like mRNA interferase family)
MRLPRDLSAQELERALRRTFGYVFDRQKGSHRRLIRNLGVEQHLTVPAHDPIKIGTLRAILREVAAQNEIGIDKVLERLQL